MSYIKENDSILKKIKMLMSSIDKAKEMHVECASCEQCKDLHKLHVTITNLGALICLEQEQLIDKILYDKLDSEIEQDMIDSQPKVPSTKLN